MICKDMPNNLVDGLKLLSHNFCGGAKGSWTGNSKGRVVNITGTIMASKRTTAVHTVVN